MEEVEGGRREVPIDWGRGERDEEPSSCVASSVVSAASGEEVGVACGWVASSCLGVSGLWMV